VYPRTTTNETIIVKILVGKDFGRTAVRSPD
jgi:hypothetical protein